MQPTSSLPPINFSYKSGIVTRDSTKLPESVKSCFLRRSASQQEVQRFDLENIIIRSTMMGSICQLCETRYKQNQMGSIADCEHQFCKRCIRDYLVYKISVMEEVNCPQENCTKILDTTMPCYQDLPEEYKQRHTRFLLWKQTISNPNLRLCPAQRCNGVINTLQSFACNTCKTQFCGECMLPKHAGPCDTNFQRNFKEWKRCPSCKMFIEKTEGCNHMTCICGHQFCYVCLADWQERHYQCGSVADVFQGGVYRQYLIGQHHPRWQQILIGIIMIILIPVVFLLGVGALIVCIGVAAVLGALVGPCLVGSSTFTSQCCGPWCIILLVTLPIIMTVCAIGAALKVLYEGIQIIMNVMESYFSTIGNLFCPPQQIEFDPQIFLQELN